MFFWIYKTVVLLTLLLCLPFWYFSFFTFLVKPNSSEQNFPVAMVLGAGVNANTEPSIVLEKRLDKAVELYKEGRIKKILVSGDNRDVYYNEPLVMKAYLVKSGVSSSDIVQDFAGIRTLDSCWRAKNVFKLKKIVLITQPFHLPRSNYLCKSVGLETQVVASENARLRVTTAGVLREIPASWLATWESFDYSAEIKANGSETDLGKY